VASAITALFLVVQLTIPTVLLFAGDDRSQRFGWQMFSKPAPAPTYVVTVSTGEQVTIDLFAVLARPRGDLPLDDLIPPHACATVPGAVRVIWEGGSLEC